MKYLRKYMFSFLSFILLFGIITYGFRSIQESTSIHEKESLEKALYRGMMECYALEGRYPSHIDYLVDNYRIIYNQEKYDIQYEVIASNIIPNITIIEKD